MTDDIREHRVTAALAYVPPLFFIAMRKKGSPFCQFHAKQGIALFMAWIAVSFFGWAPPIGWLAWVAAAAVTVTAAVRTLDGKSWELPFIGTYAARIKL